MEIKKTLDNMPRIVVWRLDEALVMLIPFLLGILFESFLLMVAGILSAWIYRRTLKKFRELNFQALLYWYLGAGFQKIPSYIRRIRK